MNLLKCVIILLSTVAVQVSCQGEIYRSFDLVYNQYIRLSLYFTYACPIGTSYKNQQVTYGAYYPAWYLNYGLEARCYMKVELDAYALDGFVYEQLDFKLTLCKS